MLTHRSKFFAIFPPPDVLAMPSAGLHISDDAIRAIFFKKNHSHYSVNSFFERALPKGLIDGGIITNENALAQELKKVKEKMGLTFVRVALPESRMYLFTVDVPNMREDAVRGYIETKLEENVPIPPAEVIFEFDTYEKNKISVSAFSEKLIQSYLSACTLAGLTVLGFDTEPRCLLRALNTEKTVLYVDISDRNTSMYVVSARVALFSSTIPFGAEAIAQSMSVVTDEIGKVVSYWNAHAEKNSITQIYVLGRAAESAGFVEYVKKTLNLPVSIANVWEGILEKESVPPITHSDALNYGVAIGLGIKE